MTLRTMMLAVALGLVAAACGGSSNGDQENDSPSPTTAATAPSSPAATTASKEPSPTVAPRTDGLSGAPVPPLEAQSSEFDEDRFNAGAGGSFAPLNNPNVVSAAEATWLKDDNIVLGAVQNGEARAYPVGMMTYHHISNDVLGGEPYLVTF